MKVSQIPSHFVTLRNGHQLVATARRLGLPTKQARALGKTVQVVRSPREFVLRRRLAGDLLKKVRPPLTLGDGYVRFKVDELPSGEAALATCQEIAEDEKTKYRPEPGGKGFLRSLLTEETLRSRGEILSFATSPEIVAVVSKYLGAIPTLSDARLWWSVPSETPQPPASSQKFHRDHEDTRQVKVFVNIHEITEDAGPFTFLPASPSRRVAKVLSPYGRQEDGDVLAQISKDELIALMGPAGDAAMVDTCSCLHYGSRNESAERLLLMLHYVSYNSIFEPDSKVLTNAIRAEWQNRDPEIAALMRIRPEGM